MAVRVEREHSVYWNQCYVLIHFIANILSKSSVPVYCMFVCFCVFVFLLWQYFCIYLFSVYKPALGYWSRVKRWTFQKLMTEHKLWKSLNPGVISKVDWVRSSRWTWSWIGLLLLPVTDVSKTNEDIAPQSLKVGRFYRRLLSPLPTLHVQTSVNFRSFAKLYLCTLKTCHLQIWQCYSLQS